MIYALFILFVVLQAADAATTTYGIRNGLKEANPVMRWLIGRLGLYVGQAAIRLPIIAMVSYFALTGGLEEWAMIALVVPFAALLANNLYWLLTSCSRCSRNNPDARYASGMDN